ncbi:MAG TPA: DUF6491 family protein [Allosphingosinicella sp.]|jgi:hypothetical protein
MKTLLLPLLAAAVAAPALASPAPARAPEVSIPFATHARSIRNFEAPSDDILFLEDRQRRWYRAEIGGPCFGLRWATAIGYDTRGRLSLDQGSHILVDGNRCTIVSITRSEGPPRKMKKAKRA